jgi:hypothetical protein
MPDYQLETADALELGELLVFLRKWLSGADRDQLATSFTRFVGHDAYPLAELCQDLDRFAFLLGASDGEKFLGADEQ